MVFPTAWLESHQSLRDHPKKDRLAELLFNGTVPIDVSDYAAAGLLHYLWYWALDYAQDGDLAKFSDSQVARGCRWNGDSMLLVKSLIEAGFVNKDRSLHHWDEYAGMLLATRSRHAARKKAWRTGPVPSASGDLDGTGPGPCTNQQTYKPLKKGRISSIKGQVPVDKSRYCPEDGATIQADGHCPVCQQVTP